MTVQHPYAFLILFLTYLLTFSIYHLLFFDDFQLILISFVKLLSFQYVSYLNHLINSTVQ